MVNSPMFTLSTRRWEVVSIAAVDMTIFGARHSSGRKFWWEQDGLEQNTHPMGVARGEGQGLEVACTRHPPVASSETYTHTHPPSFPPFPPSPRTNTEQDHAEEK